MPEPVVNPSRADLRLFVRKVLITFGLGALALVLFHWRHVILLGFGACVAAVILRSLADPISRRTPLGEGGSLAVAVMGVIALVAAVSWLAGSLVTRQLAQLEAVLPDAWATAAANISQYDLGRWLLGQVHEAAGGHSALGPLASRVGRFTGLGVQAIGEFVVVLVAGVYFAAQPRLYRDGLLKLVPQEARPAVAGAVAESGATLRKWLVGTAAAMLTMGVLTAVGTALLGLPSPMALGLLSGLAEFVPIVGAIVSAIPAVILSATQGVDKIIWTIAFYVAAHQFEGHVLIPLIQRRVVAVPPALTLFSVVGFGVLFGATGVILATPLAVVALVMIKRLYLKDTSGGGAAVAEEAATQPVGARGRI